MFIYLYRVALRIQLALADPRGKGDALVGIDEDDDTLGVKARGRGVTDGEQDDRHIPPVEPDDEPRAEIRRAHQLRPRRLVGFWRWQVSHSC